MHSDMLINKGYLFNLISWCNSLRIILPYPVLQYYKSVRILVNHFLRAAGNDTFIFFLLKPLWRTRPLSELLSSLMTDGLKEKKDKQSQYLASKLKMDISCSPFHIILKIHTGLSSLRCWYFLKCYHRLLTNRDISCSKLSAVIACINHHSWREQMFRVWKSNTTI